MAEVTETSKAKKAPKTKAKKERKVSKVRAYAFPTLVVIARSVEEARERHVKEGGKEGTEPTMLPVRFAY